eukprot:6174090-Pleurochrysis_carterae.AAC.2
MPLVHEDGRVDGSSVRRVFQDVFGARVPCGAQDVHRAAYEFVGFAKLAEVSLGYVGEAHHVVAVTYRRRTAVGRGGGREQA